MPSPPQSRSVRLLGLLAIILMTGQLGAARYEETAALLVGEGPQPEIAGERLWFAPWLRELFAEEANARHWRSSQLTALRAEIERSRDDGLDPHDYLAARLTDMGSLSDGERELLATEALARLVFSLRLGKTDPVTLDPNWNYSRNLADLDPVAWLRTTIRSDSINEALAAVRPSSPWYPMLVQALHDYRKRAQQGAWRILPEGNTLKPGMTDARIPLLRARLVDSGDIDADVAAAGASDVYDEVLLGVVRNFQGRHGLATDGAVGPRTLAALNVPITDRIDQLRVNLERLRWLGSERAREFVAVNIATYSAVYFADGEIRWRGRAIVGRPGRQTPAFRDDLSYLRLNPSWTVPPTILRQDVLPGVRRDPDYLRKHHLRLIAADGSIVDPASVDWRRARAASFPYTLRQDPGAENALGRVAIMFPNRHAVYMHDTPTRELFAKPERMLSSGCIRIENPVALAEMLIDNPAEWNRDALDAAIATDKTVRINLPRKIPIMLFYLTAFPDKDGRIHFRQDLYGRDQPVLDALNAPFHAELVDGIVLPSVKKSAALESASGQEIDARTPALPVEYRANRATPGDLDGQKIACRPV